MSQSTPAPTKGIDQVESVADRDIRALAECMTVIAEGGDVYTVTTESGSEYHVDGRDETRCTCLDAQYREPDGGCKHYRRVQFATGERPIPECFDIDRVDPHLGEHIEGSRPFANEQSPITDGGVRATESLAENSGFTYHTEPEAQGGKRYVRCEDCGRELLCCLGGREDLPHKDGCSNGEGY